MKTFNQESEKLRSGCLPYFPHTCSLPWPAQASLSVASPFRFGSLYHRVFFFLNRTEESDLAFSPVRPYKFPRSARVLLALFYLLSTFCRLLLSTLEYGELVQRKDSQIRKDHCTASSLIQLTVIMSFILAVVAVGVSAVYHAIKFKGLDSSTMPPQATSLVIPHKPKHDKTDRTGLDAQVRIYAALLDQGAFGESFGSQVAISTAPAIAAFNAFGECIGVANTVCSLGHPWSPLSQACS